jgi:ApaG protein
MQLLEMFKNPYEYKSQTDGVEVCVRPFYAKELSHPSQNKYVFVYKVKITNYALNSIQLISREWNIVEEDGTKYHIEGEGVIGKQPIIESGSDFEYASQAILYQKSGIMYGIYSCVNMNTLEVIEVKIPAFSLDVSVN